MVFLSRNDAKCQIFCSIGTIKSGYSSSELCETFKKYYKCILTECRALDSKSVLVVGKNPRNFAFLRQPKQIFERDSSFFM